MNHDHDTIVAPATAAGGAIAVIRVSGDNAVTICGSIFRGRTPLSRATPQMALYGHVVDGERIVDDVLVTPFRAPRSYTGEDTVEISCHGSRYIVAEILRLLLAAGARMAQPGEFTTRAFLAGKMDLAQAEAVADLIASSSRAAHALASTQMRGNFSDALRALRTRLIELASLLELELDFSEEDVEFADRAQLRQTILAIRSEIERLRNSFSLGNALKHGVAVAIVGAPNVGKSTLLNHLLGEERAMVSDVAGTTRDAIEETLDIDGVLFRFIDTAGIRTTDDRLEQMGIERSLAAIARARIVIHMRDVTTPPTAWNTLSLRSDQQLVEVVNKIDALDTQHLPEGVLGISAKQGVGIDALDTQHLPEGTLGISAKQGVGIDTLDTQHLPEGTLGISAKQGVGIDALRQHLRECVDAESVYHGDAVISSTRHYEALTAASDSLARSLSALDTHLPTDLLSEEIRTTLHHLGTITGEITSDEILGTIFSKFCIGK